MLLQGSERQLLEHAVDPKACLQSPIHHLEMDVGGAVRDGQAQQRPERDVGALEPALDVERFGSLPADFQLAGELADVLHRGDVRLVHDGRRLGPGRGRRRCAPLVQDLERLPDAAGRGRDDLDVEAGPGPQIVHDARLGRVVHGHHQSGAHPRQRHHAVLHRKARVDEVLEARIQRDLVQVEELDVELHAEGAADLLFGGVAEPDERLAHGQAGALLLGQGQHELIPGDAPGVDEDVAQARAAPVELHHHLELSSRDDLAGHEEMPEQDIALEPGLQSERFLKLLGGDDPLGHEELADLRVARGCHHRQCTPLSHHRQERGQGQEGGCHATPRWGELAPQLLLRHGHSW